MRTDRYSGRWLLWLLVCMWSGTMAQTQVQVVTKTIEKELPYADGQPIRLMAQKADVIVRGWNRPVVSIRLRLIAKHPDRAVAERELAYHQYTLQATGTGLDLANRFVIPQAAGKLKSQLKAVFEVNVPARSQLTINDAFGDISLTDWAGEGSVNLEFGRLTLEEVGGRLTIASEYADIDGRQVNAVLTGKTQKAEVSLRGLGGTVKLYCKYGKLVIWPNAATLDGLQVDAAGTEIMVIPKRIEEYQYVVQSAYSTVQVPDGFREFLKKKGVQQRFDWPVSGRKPLIKIDNDYAPVIIQSLSDTNASTGK